MRVTFILPTVGMSGGIRVVAIYAKLLADWGHAVTLISLPPPAVSLKQRLISVVRGKGWSVAPPNTASYLDNLDLNHLVLAEQRPICDADVPDSDVVVATWWETAEWINSLSPCKGAKVYFIQHHELFEMLPWDRVRATYRMPLQKIVIAKWIRTVMEQEYLDFNCVLIPNSVDTNQFHAPVRTKSLRPTVGFLYSPAKFKGVDITLAAIRLLRERLPNLRVISFGAEHPEGFEHWDTSIEFEYSPAQDHLRDKYAQCDVWITASRSEGFNLPAMEAMACRTPVVSTKTGWPEESITSFVNGVLVEVDDTVALARAAEFVLSLSSAEWSAMSLQAYQTATSGSWEASGRQFEQALIHSALAQNGSEEYKTNQ